MINGSMVGSGLVLVLAACSSTKSEPGPAGGVQSTAAAVAGADDKHCASKAVVVASQAACHAAPAEAGTPDAGDAGGDGGAPASEYGPTQYNSEGEDDDCKYHVKWTSTPVAKDTDVTLAIVATNRNNQSPVAGVSPYAEVFLNDTHPGPNTPVKTVETAPGKYAIGPVRFDVSGKWNVRFHFAPDCTDGEESPHGHVAFYVNVP